MVEKLRLPDTGLLRISTVLKFIEFSPSDWWEGVKSGDYPQPIQVKGKTRWRAEDIREYINQQKPQENG